LAIHKAHLFFLCLCSLTSLSFVGQIQLILVNNCNYSVWPGTLGNAGHLTPKDGGFHLARFEEAVYDVPEGWSGRIWDRTGCCFDEHGGGYCDTGDCGRRLHCMGKWGRHRRRWWR
ncbi:hypothetical protein BHE74_00034098, partial [Ensete ventricosum]